MLRSEMQRRDYLGLSLNCDCHIIISHHDPKRLLWSHNSICMLDIKSNIHFPKVSLVGFGLLREILYSFAATLHCVLHFVTNTNCNVLQHLGKD